MSISFDAALGVHDDALLVRAKRAGILANNIVNADTPNYKARDIDFKAILRGESQGLPMVKVRQTSQGHQSGFIDPQAAADMMYRQPLQPAIDGNTVELQVEQAEFSKNAVAMQASFTFLDRKFSGLTRAIKGE